MSKSSGLLSLPGDEVHANVNISTADVFSPTPQLHDLEKQATRVLVLISSAYNHLRPVNRLPPEILVKVLEARGEERDLIAATHVCARWRSILTSTSYLWTKINFKYPGKVACCYLERSKGALIDVKIEEGGYIPSPAEIPTGSFPWIARMKTLSIEGEMGRVQEIVEGLCQETPNLQSLRIEATRGAHSNFGGNVNFPDNFLERYAPSLQTLEVYRISLFTFPLPRLTHLDWVTGTIPIMIEELLELFESSPLLETIGIHGDIQTNMRGPLKKIVLSELHELQWTNDGGLISLIPWLIAPKLGKLIIRVTHDPHLQWATLSSILSPDHNHIPLLLEPAQVTYVHDHGVRTCYLVNQGVNYFETTFLTVCQNTKDPNIDTITNRWFSPDLPISFSRTKVLIMEAIGGFPPPDDLPMDKFENLDRLELIGEVDSLIRMIEVDDGKPIPCAKLSQLRISPFTSPFLSEIRKVLAKRRDAGCGVKTITIPRGHESTDADVEELRKVVDEVKFEERRSSELLGASLPV